MRKILSILLISILVCSQAFSASEWDKDSPTGSDSPSDIDDKMLITQEAQDRLLSNYRQAVEVSYASVASLTVSIGQVCCSNSGSTVRKYRSNTSATTVTWANIDTGAEETSTKYYAHAVADTDATTFTVVISKSSTAPTGVTYFKLIGSFYNNSSGNITPDKVNSSSLTYDTDSKEAGYYSGWFTVSGTTEYEKTHSLSMLNATDLKIWWREDSAATEYYPISFQGDAAGFGGAQVRIDATKLYVRRATTGWGYAYDGSSDAVLGDGELLLMATLIPVDF